MMAQPNPLERYKILHELGRGPIGRVYAARDRTTGAVVALKTLDPELFSEPAANFAELFLKSARSAGLLRHRNIVRVYDAGEADGTAYIAMELLEGESLRHMLDDRPLTIARAIQIFDDIASALAYAHEEGVVHRGVKPANIIVLRSGVAKIGDFGIGQLGAAALRYGQRGGCLSYMSPEQVRGDPLDHRSDLFSLGAVFYEMLTRQALFEGSPKQIMENILHAEPPLPSKVNPHVPFAVDRIVFGMVAEHPDDRFANARVLLRELQRLEEELGLGPGASAGADEPTASVPPGGAEVVHETIRFPQRGQPEPATPQAATEREPMPRIPDPNRFRDRAPMQDASQFAPAAVEEFEHRGRIPGGEAFDDHDARFMMDRQAEPERSSGSRVATVAALALMLAVLSLGLTFFLYYSPGPGEPRTSASRMQEAPATAAAPSPSTAPPPVAVATPPPVAEATKEPATAPASPEASPPRADTRAEKESSGIASTPKPLPPEPAVAEPSPPAQTESLPARKSEQASTGGAAPAQAAPRAAQESSRIASAPKPLPPKPLVAEPSPPAQTDRLPAPKSGQPTTAGIASAQEAPRAAQESSAIASAPKPLPPKPLAAEPGPPAQTESLPARESGQPATGGTAPAQAAPRPAQPTAKISEPQPGGMATLIIAVSPQGELYVDGRHYGTTPPITTLDLKPGMHQIEIRSGSRKPYVTYVMVEPGAKRLIRHDFAAKPSRPGR